MRQCNTADIPQHLTSFDWRLGVRSNPERPRHILIAFQKDRTGNQLKNPSLFDHVNVSQISIQLNDTTYPARNIIANFKRHHYVFLPSFLFHYSQHSNICDKETIFSRECLHIIYCKSFILYHNQSKICLRYSYIRKYVYFQLELYYGSFIYNGYYFSTILLFLLHHLITFILLNVSPNNDRVRLTQPLLPFKNHFSILVFKCVLYARSQLRYF